MSQSNADGAVFLSSSSTKIQVPSISQSCCLNGLQRAIFIEWRQAKCRLHRKNLDMEENLSWGKVMLPKSSSWVEPLQKSLCKQNYTSMHTQTHSHTDAPSSLICTILEFIIITITVLLLLLFPNSMSNWVEPVY